MAYAERVIGFPEIKLPPLSGSDEGVIWMLSFVAIKCYGDVMGLRAMELLRKGERREDVWSSFVAADAVEKFLGSEHERRKEVESERYD